MMASSKIFQRVTAYSSFLALINVNLLAAPLLIFTVATALPLAASASNDPEYDAGLESYKANKYQEAVDHFSKSIEGGNKSASVFLLSGHCFANLNQLPRAYRTYEVVTKAFKGTPEATTASDLMTRISQRLGTANAPVAATATATATAAPGGKGAAAAATTPPKTPAAKSQTAAAPGAQGLLSRIVIWPPLFGHQPVSAASIDAAQQAVKALPVPLRKKLDDSDARVIIAPNIIDRWPDTLKDLNEDAEELNMTELPGRIYGHDMCVYERQKTRGNNTLKAARPPLFMKLQVGNMCFQVLDEMMTISKDPACRKEWEADKERMPDEMETKLATFLKADDWGPRETCSELFGSMIGGKDDNTEDVYRYFPNTKKWLRAKLGLP